MSRGETIHDWGVRLLTDVAGAFGLSFETFSVWLFGVVGPLLLVVLSAWVAVLHGEARARRIGPGGRRTFNRKRPDALKIGLYRPGDR